MSNERDELRRFTHFLAWPREGSPPIEIKSREWDYGRFYGVCIRVDWSRVRLGLMGNVNVEMQMLSAPEMALLEKSIPAAIERFGRAPDQHLEGIEVPFQEFCKLYLEAEVYGVTKVDEDAKE